MSTTRIPHHYTACHQNDYTDARYKQFLVKSPMNRILDADNKTLQMITKTLNIIYKWWSEEWPPTLNLHVHYNHKSIRHMNNEKSAHNSRQVHFTLWVSSSSPAAITAAVIRQRFSVNIAVHSSAVIH